MFFLTLWWFSKIATYMDKLPLDPKQIKDNFLQIVFYHFHNYHMILL
jgi:hypothetical protein